MFWSTNVLTNVLYFIDAKYMICQGQFKLVSRNFKKAVEIVMRVQLTQATKIIEKSVDLIEKERELWYKSEKVAHMRNVMKDLHNSSVSKAGESVDYI